MSVKLLDLVDFITIKESGLKFDSPEYKEYAKEVRNNLLTTYWNGGVYVLVDFDDPEYVKECIPNDPLGLNSASVLIQ